MRYVKIAVFFVLAVAAGMWLMRPATTDAGGQAQVTETKNSSIFNILLMGCDASGVRTDSIMLLHVDGADNRVDMLSLPRDSKIYYNGSYHKLNSISALYGAEAMAQTVEQLTGVPVDYYVRIYTGGFAQLVDALGGLEYEVEQDMVYSDPAQDLYINLKKGKQLLSGEQCEQYCRYRSYVMGDLTRTQRQRKLLTELLRQKLKLQYVIKLPALWHILNENTDTDLSAAEVISYLPLARSFCEQNVIFVQHDCPGEYNDMKKERISYYLIDRDALKEMCLKSFACE
ncbi:MAG: LCP family protein [Clostridia bacterium]|nr:LCP family protein [Clostridia bacterium]